jgi:hypothetical protein
MLHLLSEACSWRASNEELVIAFHHHQQIELKAALGCNTTVKISV